MSYDNEKRFALFINDKKGNEKAPDMKGTIQIDGVKYYLSAWTGIEDGKKYLSGSCELPKETPKSQIDLNAPKEDDLPF